MLRTLLIMMLIGTALAGTARNLALEKRLDELVTKGNKAYEAGNRKAVLQYADSIEIVAQAFKKTESWDEVYDYYVERMKLYGDHYYLAGDYKQALWCYTTAKEAMDALPNTSFRNNRLVMRRELAQAYYKTGQYEEAKQLLSEVDEMLEDGLYLEGDDEWLVIKLTYALTKARLNKTEEAVKMARYALDLARDKKSEAYAKAQRMYGKILLLAEADKKGALKAYKDYFKIQQQYALDNLAGMDATQRGDYWQMIYPFIADCYSLEEADPAFLYDVALFSKGLLLQLQSGTPTNINESIRALRYSHNDIRKKLKKGEAAIEVIEYDKDGKRKVAALVLNGNGKVKFYRLPDENEILNVAGTGFTSKGIEGKEALSTNRELQEMVWHPEILKGLKGVEKIYISPDGYLHKLGVEYMPQVADKKIYRLTTTRNLMQTRKKIDVNVPMLLVGKINYDLDLRPGPTIDNDTEAYKRFIGNYFSRLDVRTDESGPIYKMRNNPADTLLTFSNASEYAFRELAPDYGMILVSTHGIFDSQNPRTTDLEEINPEAILSNNIVAFSGVNSYLNKGIVSTTQGDGLLSAKEISRIDLNNCRLFVASACQSGLGEITPDGVFGFQRGLKMAGVESMIVSLWNVNSAATYMIMNLTYANLQDGMDLHDAFNAARETMKSGAVNSAVEPGEGGREFDAAIMAGRIKVPFVNEIDYSLPQYTDAFILVDALP